ncbi:hypothetical protein LTR36_004030 [Oleoguttula mirabilis]|uniref:Uncharacterized protein n=1 Tax=Oleoguttula mirabilis TaxID=1507867 RepID=A0AAV9JHS6_9PEZI|nr:hypothetical protein LTR36_004030 [Oleoguttula mirabilis]
MARKASSSIDLPREEAAQSRVPPWELNTAAIVPWIDANSEPLSAGEREGLPELWAVQQSAPPRMLTRMDTDLPSVPSSFSPVSARPSSPWTAGQPSPYETPVFIPAALNTSASAPVYHTMADHHPKAPLTPPDSSCGESPKTSDESAKVTALPGTMSSRGGTPHSSRSRARSAAGQQHAGAESNGHSRNFSRRVKAAFKNIFKTDQVDEGEIERIGDCHWTDE